MLYQVYMQSVLARVNGQSVRLYAAMVDRFDGHLWVPFDESLLYDSIDECFDVAMELRELYGASILVDPDTLAMRVFF